MTTKNKICWAKGCNEEQIKDSWYCEKHDKEEYVQSDQPISIIYMKGGNPNKPDEKRN